MQTWQDQDTVFLSIKSSTEHGVQQERRVFSIIGPPNQPVQPFPYDGHQTVMPIILLLLINYYYYYYFDHETWDLLRPLTLDWTTNGIDQRRG
jgi:hypothetical protein